MPIYTFECEACGNHDEIILSMSDNSVQKCTKCNGDLTRTFPNKCSFKLKYNPKTDMVSWGNEGYASSMYWSDVKQARFEGKKVKGANEQ